MSAKNPAQPKIFCRQKPAKNPIQKPAKNPLKICDKNFFWTKIFYHLTKN
jgi:hypothetical protein